MSRTLWGGRLLAGLLVAAGLGRSLGQGEPAPALSDTDSAEGMAAVDALEDPQALAGIALAGESEEVRARAVSRIHDDGPLVRIATESSSRRIALLAVEGIAGQPALAAVGRSRAGEEIRASAVRRLTDAGSLEE